MIHYDSLLQNVTDIVTKCNSYFITKCDRSLLQNASGFFLQNATILLQIATAQSFRTKGNYLAAKSHKFLVLFLKDLIRNYVQDGV